MFKMTCPICCDDMDMLDYKDERAGTETCFKLDCEHAFHTKCIVQFLTRTEHKCPSCNQHKTPEQQIERAGVIRNLLNEIKKDERVKIAKAEFISATTEYKSVIHQIKQEAREWAHARSKELQINKFKSYWLSSVTAVKTAAKEVAAEKGFKYTGALNADDRTNQRYGMKLAEQVIFGKTSSYNDWRLKNPRIWARL